MGLVFKHDTLQWQDIKQTERMNSQTPGEVSKTKYKWKNCTNEGNSQYRLTHKIGNEILTDDIFSSSSNKHHSYFSELLIYLLLIFLSMHCFPPTFATKRTFSSFSIHESLVAADNSLDRMLSCVYIIQALIPKYQALYTIVAMAEQRSGDV